MNISNLTYLLQQPKEINAKQISDVRGIIGEFPYFQSARALYLKGLKIKESFKYNQELKITAAYTTDRSILFDFITSEAFNQNKISEHIKQNIENLKAIEVNDIEDISVNKSVIIDDNLKQQIEATEPVLNPKLFQSKDLVTDDFTLDTTAIEETPEDVLKIGKPLNFKKNEVHSFSEWLKITSFKPIIRDAENKELENSKTLSKEQKSKDVKSEIIDKFIQSNPKIASNNTHTNWKEIDKRNIAKAQMMTPKSLMTETLARIYVEQKNYEKAIKSYKILSLKYPEKSGLFADQIKAIKALQKNNKES